MNESNRLMAVLDAARSAHGSEAVRRLEAPVRAVAALGPAGTSPHELQYPSGLYIPELKAAPWHDRAWVPDVALLEAAAPAMRTELDRLLARRHGFQPFDEGEYGFTPDNITGAWNVVYLYLDRKFVPAMTERCPNTVAALRSLPNLAMSAMFSALTPGTHLWAHCGPTNTVISLSMGLIVPDGCTIRVGTEERHWTEGRCLVFDDSFEHEVWHTGTSTRFIMLLDVWHPELTPVERQVVAQLLWTPGEADARQEQTTLDGQQWW